MRAVLPLSILIFSRVGGGVAEAAVLPRRLNTVAALAQALPIGPIPKQLSIAFVRDDVINFGCRCRPTLPRTLNAPRVLLQIRFALSAPLSCISSL